MSRGIARITSIALIVVVVAAAAIGVAFFASQNSGILGTFTTTIMPSTNGTASSGAGGSPGASTSTVGCSTGGSGAASSFSSAPLQSHLQRLNNRDINGLVNDYTPTGSIVWSGITQGLGGTYSGPGQIRLLFSTAVGAARTLSYTVQSFNVTGGSGGCMNADALLNFNGTSSILGEFNGTITATYSYVLSSGTWLISEENWNYKAFNIQFSQGATTFPQWQITGPPLPFRYSESPFKNWVYFYGGAAAAVILAGMLATLPAVTYLQRSKKKKTTNNNQKQY